MGRIRSYRNRFGRRLVPRILKPGNFGWSGYQKIGLWNDKRQVYFLVHRIVLESFLGPSPAGFVADHIDHNRSNNRLDNLRWVSQRENVQRAYDSGRCKDRSSLKLNVMAVTEIRRAHASGKSVKVIAYAFGISPGHVASIVSRRSWKNVA